MTNEHSLNSRWLRWLGILPAAALFAFSIIFALMNAGLTSLWIVAPVLVAPAGLMLLIKHHDDPTGIGILAYQGLRSVAAILEFAPFDLARLHRQPRRDALQRLLLPKVALHPHQRIARAQIRPDSRALPNFRRRGGLVRPTYPIVGRLASSSYRRIRQQ